MSKRANPTVIGAFVIGAVALLATGVAIFGGKELFAERNEYVAYFVEQTTGLRVGSNVLMNGVRVGYVSDIDLLVDEATYDTTTRVTMVILPNTFIQTRDGQLVGEMRAELSHDDLIYEGGLRAQLQVESFVTGQLLVDLSLLSETQPVLRGGESDVPEIPTIPSSVQQLLTEIREWLNDVQNEFDVQELGTRIRSILVGMDELSNSQELRTAIAGFSEFINRPDTQGLTEAMRRTFADLSRAADDASLLFRNADEDIDSLVSDLKPVLARLTETLDEAEQTLEAAKTQLKGDSEQIYQLEAALGQIEGAARSMREFFDYLERNPEALLQGK